MIARLLAGPVPRTPTAVSRWRGAAATHHGPAVLLDVREPQEWQAGHAPQAEHIPLGQLESRLAELPRDRQIICRLPVRPPLSRSPPSSSSPAATRP